MKLSDIQRSGPHIGIVNERRATSRVDATLLEALNPVYNLRRNK